MAKPRYIAPWHRVGLEEADLEAMSPESAELLASLKGKPAIGSAQCGEPDDQRGSGADKEGPGNEKHGEKK
jgi:hypothetical protein